MKFCAMLKYCQLSLLSKGPPGAGSGKTLLAIEFLVRGATAFGEPGVSMAFEETKLGIAVHKQVAHAVEKAVDPIG